MIDVPDYYVPDREAEEPFEREREQRNMELREEIEWQLADWAREE